MKLNKVKLALVFILFSLGAFCDTLPKLRDTDLFKKYTSNCESVDLSTWSHPTRNVIAESGTELKKVELCNNKKYPIFYVDFKYDPQGQTKNFYTPFYEKMRVANGSYALAFIDISDNTIVYLNFKSDRTFKTTYEMYLSGSE